MSYKIVQDAVGAVIKGVAGYDAANVKADDYRVIAHGKVKAVILRRGVSSRKVATLGPTRTVVNNWVVNAELYIPFRTEGSAQADDVVVEAQKLVDELDKYPLLNNAAGVINSEVQTVGEPEEWVLGGRWWRQVIAVFAQETVTVTTLG